MKKIHVTLRNIVDSTRVTHGFGMRLYILCLYLYLSTKRWLGLKPEFKTFKKIRVTYNNISVPFFLKRQLDFDVLRDAFINDQYEINDTINPKVIFDLGSNIGTTVLKFYLRYPEAHIYAVEPDPKNFESLKKNTEFLDDRITIIQKAISGTDDESIKFYTGSQYHWSSSIINRTAKYTSESIEVETLSIDRLIRDNSILSVDIIKCDIEGAEVEAFKGCTLLNYSEYILGELHPDIINISPDEFFGLFKDFQLFSLDREAWVFKLKRRALIP